MLSLITTLICLSLPGGNDCTTEIVHVGPLAIYAWSEDMVGQACRSWNEDATTVRVDVDIQSGGYDAGVAYSESPQRVTLSKNGKPLVATLKTELRGHGTWWAGPKFVICRTPQWESLVGNHECYIVETASKSPEEMVDFFYGSKLVGQTVVDGAVYKHYIRPWESWKQWIAIRQDYRDVGSFDYASIVDHWHRQLGLPDWYLHSPKVGLETHGQVRGWFEWTDIKIVSMRQ